MMIDADHSLNFIWHHKEAVLPLCCESYRNIDARECDNIVSQIL